MISSKIHHRLPFVGRSYQQRNEARRQRDQAQFERDEARRERDQARMERDEARKERAEVQRELASALKDQAQRELPASLGERDKARQKREEAQKERNIATDRPSPQFHIEQIGSNFAFGWAFGDSAPITRVVAKRDQQVIASTSSFLSRPDVAAAYPKSNFAGRSGFQLFFDPPKVKGLSKLSLFSELDGTEFLLAEGLTTDPSAFERQLGECHYEVKSCYPAAIGKCFYVMHEDTIVDIERVCEILSIYDLKGTRQISDYIRYVTSCWSHFNFVAGSFPTINRNSEPGKKDYFCKANSPLEMISIAHHLYVLKSYGIQGDFAEFGCFKGFSSSMLSYACSLLGIQMHIYNSFEGLPPSASSYYDKGDFSGNLDEVRKNIAQFGEIKPVMFHKGFFSESLKKEMPPPLACLWMDVDLDSSARDVLKAAKMLSPSGAIFSHECSAENFSGATPRFTEGGPNDVVPAILSYYESEASPANGLFVAGNTGAFWNAREGVPVLPTNDLRRLLTVLQT